MKKTITVIIIWCMTLIGQAQVSKNIYISSPGTLSTNLTASEKTTVTNLTISGNIDARDFKTMRDKMPLLRILDLKAVSIKAYTDSFPENEIPENSFINNFTLKSIDLPATTTSIGNLAFYNCDSLSNLIIPKSVVAIKYYVFAYCSN